jgi:hypothetical protein
MKFTSINISNSDYKFKYVIEYIDNEEYIEATNLDEAYNTAYRLAVDDYESYAGYHGILSEADIAEEEFGIELEDADEATLDEINTRYCEEIENTISYGAEEIFEEEYKEYMEG